MISQFTVYECVFYNTGVPGRDEKFDDRARNFESHASKLADTANMVATAGGCNNKQTVQEIFKTSNQVEYYMVLGINSGILTLDNFVCIEVSIKITLCLKKEKNYIDFS